MTTTEDARLVSGEAGLDRVNEPTARQRWAWRAAAIGTLVAFGILLMLGPYRPFLVGSVVGSRAEDRPAPCLPGQAVAVMDSPHITQAEAAAARYNSEPPTSGPHFAFVAAPGIYASPIPDGLTVHALEHGHVVIQYGADASARTVSDLRAVARRYPFAVILAPRNHFTGIALTAWGRLEQLNTFDEGRVVRFIEVLAERYDHGWTRPDPC